MRRFSHRRNRERRRKGSLRLRIFLGIQSVLGISHGLIEHVEGLQRQAGQDDGKDRQGNGRF